MIYKSRGPNALDAAGLALIHATISLFRIGPVSKHNLMTL